MNRFRSHSAVVAAALTLTSVTTAAAPSTLTVTIKGLDSGNRLPASSAYCVAPTVAATAHDISPAVSWSAGPPGTQSYVLIMSDPDVPADMSLINKPGVTIAADAPRMTLVHWVLVDIPSSIRHLKRGAESAGFEEKGKPVGATDHGIRGANAYSNFYPEGSPLAGPRGGFDGPCTPSNDQIAHHYVTTVYALDIKSLGLSGVFFADAALAKMQGHILAQGQVTALYGTGAGDGGTKAAPAAP